MYETLGSYDFIVRLLIATPLVLSIILCSYVYIRYSSSLEKESYINFALPIFTILILFQSLMPVIRLLASDLDTQVRLHLPMNTIDLMLPSAVYGVLVTFFFFSLIYSLNYASNRPSLAPSFTREDIDSFSLKIIYLICVLILTGLFSYLDSIYSIMNIIENPREFYKSSRVGFGHVYYLIALMLKLIFLLSLHLFKSSFTRIIIFISISVLISFLGSKSQILSMFFIYALYTFFIEKKYFNLRMSLILVGSVGTLLLFFFLYLQRSEFSILVKILNYFDYFENFLTLFNKLDSYYLGILTLESNMYSVMPRIVFPDKPLYFGSIQLGTEIYPEQTYLNQGAPSLSFFGRGYADFGILSFVYFSLSGAISGFVIGTLSHYRTIYSFIILLAFAYNPLFTFGSDGFVVEIFNIFLSFILFLAVSIIGIISSKKTITSLTG